MSGPSRPSSTRGRALAKLAALLAVLVASVLLAFLLAEVIVRVGAPQQLIQIRPDVWQPVDTLGYVRRPNISARINTGERTVSVFSDNQGYRVGAAGRREVASQVLLLGDSFVEALQVEHEQTTAYYLEEDLGRRLGRDVAVRNAGVSGWNPNHYLLRARQLMSRERFDLVVVALFVGNDAVAYTFDRIGPRQPVERRRLRLPQRAAWSEIVGALFAPLNDALEMRSHLYVLAKNQLSTFRMRVGMTADYLPVEYQVAEGDSPRWTNTAQLCVRLARLAGEHGTPVLFVLVPERFQVYPDEFRRYLRGFGIDSTTVDVDQPSRLLEEALAAKRLHVINVLQEMRAAARRQGPRLYGTVDQHLSPEGHRVLASLVADTAARLARR